MPKYFPATIEVDTWFRDSNRGEWWKLAEYRDDAQSYKWALLAYPFNGKLDPNKVTFVPHIDEYVTADTVKEWMFKAQEENTSLQEQIDKTDKFSLQAIVCDVVGWIKEHK